MGREAGGRVWVSVCQSLTNRFSCWLCGRGKRCVIQRRYLTAGVLGYDELVTADMWLMTVTVYECKSVGAVGWLRAVKKWWVVGRVVDGELLNLGFWSSVQSIV